jgi:transglutaminase-like putative cysteine protease
MFNLKSRTSAFLALVIMFAIADIPGDSSSIVIALDRPTVASSWRITMPAIDGTISDTEWEDATRVNISSDGKTADAYFKNDADWLYVAIDAPFAGEYQYEAEPPGWDATNIYLDTGNDGNLQTGWIVSIGGSAPGVAQPTWAAEICHISRSFEDGLVAIDDAAGHVQYEFEIPLYHNSTSVVGDPGESAGIVIFICDQCAFGGCGNCLTYPSDAEIYAGATGYWFDCIDGPDPVVETWAILQLVEENPRVKFKATALHDEEEGYNEWGNYFLDVRVDEILEDPQGNLGEYATVYYQDQHNFSQGDCLEVYGTFLESIDVAVGGAYGSPGDYIEGCNDIPRIHVEGGLEEYEPEVFFRGSSIHVRLENADEGEHSFDFPLWVESRPVDLEVEDEDTWRRDQISTTVKAGTEFDLELPSVCPIGLYRLEADIGGNKYTSNDFYIIFDPEKTGIGLSGKSQYFDSEDTGDRGDNLEGPEITRTDHYSEPVMTAMAAAATDPSPIYTSREKVMQALRQWVYYTMESEPGENPPDHVSEYVDLIRSGYELRGDCDCHAVFLVALARASGIPARTIYGWGKKEEEGQLQDWAHAWTEVYIDDWNVSDAYHPTWKGTDYVGYIEDRNLDELKEVFDELGNDLTKRYEPSTKLMATLKCPANLHAYDSLGNHVGMNDQGGIDLEIPDSYYTGPDSDLEEIVILGQSENVVYTVEALSAGEFDLTIRQTTAGGTGELIYQSVPIIEATEAWVDISPGNPEYLMSIDYDGNGMVDNISSPDTSRFFCYIDFSGNGVVDIQDVQQVASRWRTTDDDPAWDPSYDLDDDGIITVVDIMLVVAHWGKSCTDGEEEDCVPDSTLACGNSDSRNNSDAGSTDRIDTYSCIDWNESGPEYAYEFTPSASSQVAVSLNNLSADLDLFVLAPGCNATDCLVHDGLVASFDAAAGQTYYIVVDGYQGAVGDYTISLDCLDGGCVPDWTLDCGGGDSWNNGYPGSTDLIDTYSCSVWDESGPEYAYAFVPSVGGQVDVSLSNLTTDLDLFIVAPGCNPTDCLAYGDVTASFSVVAGQLYYVVVDGYQGAVSDYTISVSCPGVAQDQSDQEPNKSPWRFNFVPTVVPGVATPHPTTNPSKH